MLGPDSMPDEVVPDGWSPTGDGLAFEHSAAGLVAGVDRQPEDVTGATGAPPGWRVWYERRAGEATERRTVGAVTTRDAALDALLSCMRRVRVNDGESATGRSMDVPSDTAPVDGRWAALSTLAAGVTLHDAMPAAADGDGDGDVDEASYARSWAAKLDGRES